MNPEVPNPATASGSVPAALDPARVALARQLLEQAWEIVADAVLARAPDIFNEVVAAASRSGEPTQVHGARVLSVQGRELAQALRGALRTEFDTAVAAFVVGRTNAPAPRRGLSLMGMDQADTGSQVEQATARLRDLVQVAFGALVPRLQTLAGGRELADADNPLRPALFLQAIAACLSGALPNVVERNALLRHFPTVLQPFVTAAYEGVGRLLESRGIAAAVAVRQAPVLRRPNPATLRLDIPASVAELSMPGEPSFAASLGTSAAQPRAPGRAGPPTRSGMSRVTLPPPPEPADEPAEPGLHQYGKLQALSGINASAFVDAVLNACQGAAAEMAPPPAPPAALLKAMLAAQRHDAAFVAGTEGETLVGSRDQSRKLIGAAVHPVHKLAIQFVLRLFARIERDPLLPLPVRELLVALRLPCVEAALTDLAILGRADHPARRLINGVASASLGWREDGAHGKRFVQHLRNTVKFVLHSPGSAPSAFEQAAAQFAEFAAADGPVAPDILARAREALRLAEEREARALGVARFLEEILEGARLDGPLRAFLLEVWPRILIEAADRENVEPGLMRRLLNTISDLVWSVQPTLGPADRKRLVDTIPAVVAGMRDGWRLISWPEEKRQPLLEQLMQAHAEAMKATEQPADRLATPPVGGFSVSTLRIRLDGMRVEALAQAKPDGPLPVVDEAVRHVLVAQRCGVSHQWLHGAQLPALGSPDAEGADRAILRWPARSWLNVHIGGVPRRVRLEGYSPAQALALFASRRGDHLYSFSRATLATYLRAGWAGPAETLPLLARAFQTVLADLERTGRAASDGGPGAA